MRWPLKKVDIRQGYRPSDNPGHEGVDLAAPTGTTIYAPDNGRVESVNNNAAAYFGGKYIVIQGDSGYRFYLGHNSSNSVKVGQRVKEGQVIGKVGMTGQATGPHIHFEMSKGGRTYDPRKVVKEVKMTEQDKKDLALGRLARKYKWREQVAAAKVLSEKIAKYNQDKSFLAKLVRIAKARR